MEMYTVAEAASWTLLIKNYKNLQEKLLKCNSSLFYGILFCLYLYVAYMTMAEWNYRNTFAGKYTYKWTYGGQVLCLCGF